jgi:hypothetical protein
MSDTLAKRFVEYCRCCKKIEDSYNGSNEFPTSFEYKKELLFSKKARSKCWKCIFNCRNKHCSKIKIPQLIIMDYEVTKKEMVMDEINSSSDEETEKEDSNSNSS